MNEHTRTLPPLADARIDEIETAVFDGIAQHRAQQQRAATQKSARRGRWWGGGLAAAGVIAVAAVIGPSLGVATTAGGMDAASAPVEMIAPEAAPFDMAAREMAGDAVAGDMIVGGSLSEDGLKTDRDVITTASATVEVTDVVAALAEISESATAAGGFVEMQSVDGAAGAAQEAAAVAREGGTVIYDPMYGGSSWITVRVPADRLETLTASLAEVGTVTASRLDRQDVTTQTIDLRARVDALEASVQRLTGLMAEATTTADLLAAEAELSARQGELDAYRQQLAYLDGQVQMSTLTVSLVQPAPTVKADPAGFGDGIAAGWNGLVATLNGVVIGLGFLLPWLGVLAVVLLVVWGIRRLVRARRTARADEPEASASGSSA